MVAKPPSNPSVNFSADLPKNHPENHPTNLQTSEASLQDNLDHLGQAWMRMVSCIAHDLTSPLVALRMSAKIFEDILPKLLAGYKIAIEQNLLKPTLDAR